MELEQFSYYNSILHINQRKDGHASLCVFVLCVSMCETDMIMKKANSEMTLYRDE